MKVRWTTGSIRFRITPAELNSLQQGQSVSVALPLPAGPGWTATITPSEEPTCLQGGAAGTIVLHLALPDVLRLSAPENEGVYFRAALGEDSGEVRFFVEKDFPCVHPRPAEAQEETETFTAPPGFAERHKCPPAI